MQRALRLERLFRRIMENIYETFGYKETYELGVKFGEAAKSGMVICLNGDLGVGKTVFTQGFAKGLGIEEPINSPTFTIIQEYYEGRISDPHKSCYGADDRTDRHRIPRKGR